MVNDDYGISEMEIKYSIIHPDYIPKDNTQYHFPLDAFEKNIKSTRLGDLYIDIRLKDATGSIRGKVWAHVSYFSNQFNVNDIVAIKADVIEYNNTKELNVKFVKKVNSNFYSEHGYSQNLIFPTIIHHSNIFITIVLFIPSLSPF